MKNIHLVPPAVTDIVEKLNSPLARENEKLNYVMRLEAVRDFCNEMLYKHNTAKPAKPVKFMR